MNDEIGVRLPWEPFVGTIAVAPDLEAISALSPGPFEGNMDVPDVRPGNTVYLPVWNEGRSSTLVTATLGRARESSAASRWR